NTTGKLATNTVNTGVPSLAPNHSIASTSHAIGGVPRRTVTSGRDIIEAVIDTPAARPSTLPAPIASAKPISARRVVAARSGHAAPLSMNAASVAKAERGSGNTSGPYNVATASHAATSSSR